MRLRSEPTLRRRTGEAGRRCLESFFGVDVSAGLFVEHFVAAAAAPS